MGQQQQQYGSFVDNPYQVWGWELKEKMICDSAEAVSSMKAGIRTKLSYLRRTQKVSLGLLADYIASKNFNLTQVTTSEQRGDLFTKGPDFKLHVRNCVTLTIK